MTGRLFSGTSGFAYPAWSPRFYPPATRGADLLRYYASRLTACELNNTFYRQPKPAMVAAWLAATPDSFRFAVKAQRGGSARALWGDAEESIAWLTAPLRAFGSRLGAVLYRVPDSARLDVGRLGAVLAAWPRDVPLAVELRDPSWSRDEVYRRLADAGAALCATDLPDAPEPPTIRLTGPFLYLRLRRHDYPAEEIAAWADRLVPFVDAGHDAFAFFRHDEVGRAPELATRLADAVGDRLGQAPVVARG